MSGPRALPDEMESSRRKGIAPDQYVGACPDRQTASHFGGTCSSPSVTWRWSQTNGLFAIQDWTSIYEYNHACLLVQALPSSEIMSEIRTQVAELLVTNSDERLSSDCPQNAGQNRAQLG